MNTQAQQLKAIYEQGIKEANESIEIAIAQRNDGRITSEQYYAKIEKYQGWIFEYQDKLKELAN